MSLKRVKMAALSALLALCTTALAVGTVDSGAYASTGTSTAKGATLVPLATTGGCTYNSAGYKYCDYGFNPGPRVNCGGYNGHVDWEDDWYGTIWINTYGQLWSNCDTTTYLYLSWDQDMGLVHRNYLMATVGPWQSVGVNKTNPTPAETIGGVSNVAVTACSNYGGGWHCGTPYHV
jgi:hypothetical protein